MRTLLKIFVLEDEWIQQSRIEAVLQDLIRQKSLQCKAPEVFGKSSQLLDAITERGAHHLFFLDIEIKGEEKKGLEIAKEIRKKDPHATIVFVTTHSEFMPITFQYKVAALDFIDKTLGEEEFKERISSAIDYTLEQAGTTIAQDAFTFESAMARVQVPFNKILYVDNVVLKAVLYSKLKEAEDKGIKCDYNILSSLDNIKINSTELVVVISNLLNNALEAAQNSKKPWVRINIFEENNKKTHVVQVENSVENINNIDISSIMNKGYTTKGEGRGFGLDNINKIMKRVNGQILIEPKEESLSIELKF